MKQDHKRIRSILVGMKCRCKGTASKRAEKDYTEKGIVVCDEWSKPANFIAWAFANGYSDDLSIDRIDNNGNYEPSNCRWTSQLVQSANTRVLYSHNKSGYRGVSWNKLYSKWEVSISVEKKTVKVGYYDVVLDAAKAFDTYVKDNDLPHTLNNTIGRVESNIGKLLPSSNRSGYLGVSAPKRVAHLKNPWFTQLTVNGKRVFSKYADTALNAALLREQYIKDNNLNSKLNFL